MSVDPASVWYIARDGEIVWQGTANELLNWIENGGIEGNEAAWSEGFTAWVSVHMDPKTQWIRQAVAHHDERTGEPTEFSNPEGTESLDLPNVAEEGDSPFAGPRPKRNRAQPASTNAVGLPLGILSGIIIGLGVAYALWTSDHERSSVTSSPSTSASVNSTKPVSPPADRSAQAHHDAGRQTDGPTTAPSSPASKIQPAPNKKTAASQRLKTKQAKRTPEEAKTTKTQQPAASSSNQVVRIIQKKKTGVEIPQDSANRDEEIKRSMNVRKGIWEACIRRAQRDYPALVGRLIFTISVTKEGTINGVAGPPGNQGAQYAAACLLGEFDNLTFPPGRAAQIQFPYTTP